DAAAAQSHSRWSSSIAAAPHTLHSFPTRRSSDLPTPNHGSRAGSPVRGSRSRPGADRGSRVAGRIPGRHKPHDQPRPAVVRGARSEEHTSELQSLAYLVCRLLLDEKADKSAPSRV